RRSPAAVPVRPPCHRVVPEESRRRRGQPAAATRLLAPPSGCARVPPPVLVSSWNINSVRARTDRLLGWLADRRPDVVCLQELKCTDEQFPSEQVRALGYHPVLFGQKTYNGVAILARAEPERIERGFLDGEDDNQARVVSATLAGVRVASIYAPNGQAVGSPA